MISVGGGLRLPLMEGDKIRLGKRGSKTIYYWFPLCNDGRTLDLSRVNKGPRSERYLHPQFFRRLREGSHLISVNAGEFVVKNREPEAAPSVVKKSEPPISPMTGGKRRLLVRLPVWGLPPRWR
jgi:hypothetical protein